MGAKFEKRQPPQMASVQDGKLCVKNILGKEFKFDIDLGRNYRPECSNFIENVFVKLEDESTMFVCRYDGTYTVYRKSDNLVLFFGIVKELVKSNVFNVEYLTCGYSRYGKQTSILMLELPNRQVVHEVMSDVAPAGKTYVLKAEVKQKFDLLHANRLAHEHPELHDKRLFIVTSVGMYPEALIKEWRCLDDNN